MDELSTLSPAAADTTARTARTTATALTDAGEALGAATTTVGGWVGTAHISFAERAGTLRADIDLIAAIAAAGAGIIEDYSRELGLLQGRLRAIDTELADAQQRTLDVSLSVADFHSTWAAVDRWQLQRQQVLTAYDDAADRLASRLTAIIDHVPNRPRTLTEHLDDAAGSVGEVVTGGLFITLGWLDDPTGWWNTVQQLPSSLWDQVTHPVDTARDTLHVDDLEDGRYGAAAGALGAAVIGKGLGKAVEHAVPDVVPDREGDGNSEDGPDKRPPGVGPQTLDEMLVAVDLARNEGVNGAHVVAKHVDVDDQDLRNRILVGWPQGRREQPVTVNRASRWGDLATAQSVITRALRDNEAALRAMPTSSPLKLIVPAPPASGKLFVREGDGVVEVPVTKAVVVVKRDAAGAYTVHTSYLEGG